MKIGRLFLVIALMSGFEIAQAALIDQVTPSQKTQLAAGQTVVTSQAVSGYAWPKLILFRVVNAPPSLVAELFGDYSAAPSYIPGMISAKLIAVNDDGSKDVQY